MPESKTMNFFVFWSILKKWQILIFIDDIIYYNLVNEQCHIANVWEIENRPLEIFFLRIDFKADVLHRDQPPALEFKLIFEVH